MKRLVSLLLIAAIISLGILALVSCAGGPAVSENDAKEIIYKDLGITAEDVSDMHINSMPYAGKDSYNIIVMFGEESYEYFIDASTGKILHKAESDHHH